MLRMLRNNKGFSLLEVLITVGLIAVLTGIAVPSYRAYKTNAVRVAVKSDLSNGHRAYVAYDATQDSFCASLNAVGLGWKIDNSANYREAGFYGFGESDGCAGLGAETVKKTSAGGRCEDASADVVSGITIEEDCTGSNTWNNVGAVFSGAAAACSLAAQTFKMGAHTSTAGLGGEFFQIDQDGAAGLGKADGTDCK